MTINRQMHLIKIILLFIGIIFFKDFVQAQDSIRNLEWQLQQNENRINETNSRVGEASDKLTDLHTERSDLDKDLEACNERRFFSRVACRGRVNRRISENKAAINYWSGILRGQQNKIRALITTRDRLTMELQAEKALALCREQSQNQNMIDEILNAEQMKIAQEVDYDSAENGRCDSQNSWLQDQLDTSHGTQDFDQSLDPRCTYRALKEFSNCGGLRRRCFAKCEGKGGNSYNDNRPEWTRTAPCVSRQLHHSIHQAITEVSSCLRMDPKTLFSLFVNESGVHPLVRSHTNAIGVGQITGNFIEDINDNLFDLYKDEILPALSKDPLRGQSCRSVRNKVNAFGKIGSNLCSRTNHYNNIYYSAIYYLRNKNAIAEKMLRVRGKRNAPIPENSSFRDVLESNISPRTRNLFRNLARLEHLDSNDHKITTELSFYSHNLPNIRTIFQSYLDDPNENHRLGSNFVGPQGQWLRYLRSNKVMISSSESRQNEVISYIYGDTSGGGYRIQTGRFMKGRMDRIERENNSLNRERIYCRAY